MGKCLKLDKKKNTHTHTSIILRQRTYQLPAKILPVFDLQAPLNSSQISPASKSAQTVWLEVQLFEPTIPEFSEQLYSPKQASRPMVPSFFSQLASPIQDPGEIFLVLKLINDVWYYMEGWDVKERIHSRSTCLREKKQYLRAAFSSETAIGAKPENGAAF